MMKKPEHKTLPRRHNRRTFIRRNATALGGALLGSHALSSAVLANESECTLTEAEVLGPFYRFGAPFRAVLAAPDEPGQRLIIKGKVYGPDCQTPLPNALIDVWQADSAGVYDTNLPDNFTEKVDFHLRGMLYTNERGEYEIETIVPGRYPIPPGLPGLEDYAGLTRPAHLHVKVMHSMHVPITTQLYFAGDPYLAGDPWASRKPSLAMDLTRHGEIQQANFDFILDHGL